MPKKTKKDKIIEHLGTSLNVIWILGLIALVKNLVISNKVVSFLKEWLIAGAAFTIIILGSIYFKTIIVTIPLWLATIIVIFIFVTSKIVNDKV
ncbi:putative membrane protein [Desulfitispora alkaliphila]|uniref:hypothetical protein n=1 Tax=Desulfitispora alkaliphila TaxID=622674 RepID=UPI003D21979D